MKKRHNYLLLELLIALALVTTTIGTLMREPLRLTRGVLTSLEKMELERIAESSFADIKARLYENEIPWSKIPEKKEPYREEKNEKVALAFGKMQKREFVESFTLKTRAVKKDEKNREYRRVKVIVTFTPVKKKKKDEHYSFEHELVVMRE